MNGSGCKNCPVENCETMHYRGSTCAAQRAKLGLGDPNDRLDCRNFQDCPYRNDVGWCPENCGQYRHKDDVRVVRCKDCRGMNGEVVRPEGRYLCERTSRWVWDNDYCSLGERKDNE